MGLPQTAVNERFVSEQVQGVIGDKDVIELYAKCHPGHVHADIEGIGAVWSLSRYQHMAGEVKAGNTVTGGGKGLTDSSCPATQLQNMRTFGAVCLIEGDILSEICHFNGVELSIPFFAKGEKDLFGFFMIKERVIHAAFVHGLPTAGKEEVEKHSINGFLH